MEVSTSRRVALVLQLSHNINNSTGTMCLWISGHGLFCLPLEVDLAHCVWAPWSNQDFLRSRQEQVEKTLVTAGREIGQVWRCSYVELSINIPVKRVVRWTQFVWDVQHSCPRGACGALKIFGTLQCHWWKNWWQPGKRLHECSKPEWLFLAYLGFIPVLVWAVSFCH